MPDFAPIYVVEDDPDVRETLCEVLRDEGYEPAAFAEGPAALQAMSQATHLPKLVLLDLMMPTMDGWAFRDWQRKSARLRTVPTVILSADGNIAESSASLEVQGYLRKPIHIDTLLALVERFCGRPEAQIPIGEAAATK